MFVLVGAGFDIVEASTLLFIPQDNRPVSFDYSVQTMNLSGCDVITPPRDMLAGRNQDADCEKLWQWIFANIANADAAIIASDAVIYGGLVASRKHELSDEIINRRLENYNELRRQNPEALIYVFATIMRSPQQSDGGVEPDYYTEYGPLIFNYGALLDKENQGLLTTDEYTQLNDLKQSIPSKYLDDWYARRTKNLAANRNLLDLTNKNVINYFLLGRDDSWPYSQSGIEKRELIELGHKYGFNVDKFITFNGADQLGLLLLEKADNFLVARKPFVYTFATEGVGLNTVPSYQDDPIGMTIFGQVFAAGGLPVNNAKSADLVLAVYTNYDGTTREASDISNVAGVAPESMRRFIDQTAEFIEVGKAISLADISYSNGADNNLMVNIAKRSLLPSFVAYNGWNTASNSSGFAIGQGMASLKMDYSGKKYLLSQRFLEDWAYQANVRQSLWVQVVKPLGGSYTDVNHKINDEVTSKLNQRLNDFATANFVDFRPDNFQAWFPWQRMFEIEINILANENCQY